MDRVSGSPDAPDLTHPLPGRERELADLSALLNRALRGDGSTALISGEAGIGKTTLSERLFAHARLHGATVVTGHCYGTTTGQPLAPWREIGRSLLNVLPAPADTLFPGSPGSIETSGSREELFERMAHDFREAARHQPMVVILEDIHWADTASLELLRYLARQLQSMPVLLVTTCRSDEPDPADGLREILPEIVRESRAHRIDLRRLELPDVQAYLETSVDSIDSSIDRDRLSSHIHERSGGNPFFMTELLRDLGSETGSKPLETLPVPSLVRQVIENRVQRMDQTDQSLLAIASVIGQEVPVDLWQAVAACDDETLASAMEHAVANHLLHESSDGRRVHFVHGLIQETLYHGQVSVRRRRKHQQIAEWLTNRPDPPAATIAHHFSRADDPRAIDWFVWSATEALDVYAARDAISSIDQAEQISSETGTGLPLEAYRLRANAREMLGESEEGRTDLARLLQLARETQDRAAECRTLIDFGMLWAAHDYQQCGSYLRQALEIAEVLGDESLHAHCLNRLANWQANVGEFEPAIELHQQALRMFEEINDQDGIADTLDLLGTTSYLAGEYSDARDFLERSVAISRDQGNRWRLSSSLALLGNVGGDMESTFDANTVASRSPEYWIGAGEESIATAREIGWISGESFGLSMLGAVHCVRGNLGRALECAESAEAIAHRINHQQWLISASLLLGVTWGELLDQSRAEYYLERTLSHARVMGSHIWTLVSVSAMANVRLQRGDTSGKALLEPYLESAKTGRAHGKRALQFAWAHQLREAGELEEALAFAEQLLGYNDSSTGFPGTPQILMLKGDTLRDLGRMEEAAEVLSDADRIAAQLGFKAMHWRVKLARGDLEARRGNERDATGFLQAARDIAGHIARDLPDHEIRRRFIREIDRRIDAVRQAVHPPADLAGLSPRELEVLRLVARGQTDAQVAESLFISPRTVARHLQSIYTKLDVNSRTAATRLAMERDLIPRG